MRSVTADARLGGKPASLGAIAALDKDYSAEIPSDACV
jgi:hypothetical protein